MVYCGSTDVKIDYRTRKLEKRCNSSKEATKAWGQNMASKLRARLDDLRAASNLETMRNLPGRCLELKGDRKGQLSLDLVHPMRLVFSPAGDGIQMKPDSGLDWTSVTSIKIIDIEDTHE